MNEALERITDSWWPIPAAGALVAVVLAAAFLALDQLLQPSPVLAFRGDPDEARLLMSTITSAMLSFIGLVFSVSIVVFTLVSGQLSPRVLRTFLRDRWSQSTLAVFVGTFVLSLITFWSVRGSSGGARSFVPGLTVSLVFLLVAVCVGMFVHFVHHITQEIRAVTVIGRIHDEALTALDARYPQDDGRDAAQTWRPPSEEPDETFDAEVTNVLANAHIGQLVALARRHDVVLELVPKIGDFVIVGEPLVRMYGRAPVEPADVRSALAFDPERSYRSDVAFGLRKLIDIAERALSPAVNDPTTAVQCIDRIHAVLSRLAARRLDIGVHHDDGGEPRVIERVPTWDDYVALCCDELRHWGADAIRVHERLRDMLNRLIATTAAHRHPPLRRQLDALSARASADLPAVERAAIGDVRVPSRPDDRG